MAPTIILIRLSLAAGLGAVIGLERDIHGREAGFRTHLLVSLGSSLFTLISMHIYDLSGMTGDPARIAAQIVTGIGFLGAGTILKEGITIRGLTTAACLWISAAIGMSVGAGFYFTGVVSTILALLSLIILGRLVSFVPKDSYRTMTVKMLHTDDVSPVIAALKSQGIKIQYFDCTQDYEQNETTAIFFIKIFHRGATDKLFHSIKESVESTEIRLKSISWSH